MTCLSGLINLLGLPDSQRHIQVLLFTSVVGYSWADISVQNGPSILIWNGQRCHWTNSNTFLGLPEFKYTMVIARISTGLGFNDLKSNNWEGLLESLWANGFIL